MNRTRSRLPLPLPTFAVASAFALAAIPGVLDAAPEAGDRPNVLFILVDDLGWRDLSVAGSTFYETPHIDRLARTGITFTRAYATCQVCSPSRASILTGRYPTRHGITTWIGERAGPAWRKLGRHDSHLPPDYRHALAHEEVTLAEVFHRAGYATFFAGKWHLGGKGSLPTDHGFEINIGGYESGGPRGGYFGPWKNPYLKARRKGESLPLRLAEETARFIQENTRKGNRPFFAYLSFYSVHAPIQTTRALWEKYRKKAASRGPVAERFRFDRRLCVRQVQDCPIYAGMVETVDRAVGHVLSTLDACGLRDRTIICFTSDHGGVSSGDAYSTCNLPLRGGKGRQWEGGLRVPMYVVAPGLTRPGQTCGVPVSGIDWFPSLVELAGLTRPKGPPIDGVSLVPLLQGRTIPDRPLFWHYPHYGNQGGEPSSIILRDDWKLIFYHEDGRYELYHLATDPGERHDVAAQHPERVARLKAELQAWLKATGARFPTPDPQFDPKKRAARWEFLRTRGKERLERQHARFLDPDFRPNADWWGSLPQD